jgi:hypothetical protein
MRAGAVLFFFVAILSTGCVDVPDYSSTPEIQFNSIEKISFFDPNINAYVDSVVVTVDFKDGDGDLGVDEATRGDTIVYKDWGNYKLITYRVKGNVEEEYPMPENSRLFFPILKPDGKPGPIKGKLSFSQNFYKFGGTELGFVRFKILLRDRSMKVSNEELTDTVGVWVNR